MTTERLFYQDSGLKSCQAKVLECRSQNDHYEIRLDRTVFYPEGGGQPYDTGYLDQIPVLEVQEKEDEIWHYTKEAIEVGTIVCGSIDWDRRMDLMQQHSGEHIISGLIHERYGYNNVGFHMGSDTITLDVDGEICEQDLKEIEAKANQYVWENHLIEITCPSPEELEQIPYRSKKELTGEVRIVTWPGVDICACCGVHVKASGDIGQIMLVSAQKFKGGMRIEMICGKRALEYSNYLKEQNKKMSMLLSAKWNETWEAVEKLQKEYQQLKFQMVGMERKKIEEMTLQAVGKGNQLFFEEQMSPEGIRKLAADVMEVCDGRCAVFGGNDESGYRYVIGEKDGDLRGFVKEMNQKLQGRGGGKPFFVQGSLQASRKEIEAFFAS